jgi:hypothetical protein
MWRTSPLTLIPIGADPETHVQNSTIKIPDWFKNLNKLVLDPVNDNLQHKAQTVSPDIYTKAPLNSMHSMHHLGRY